jgi:hypothetical protein
MQAFGEDVDDTTSVVQVSPATSERSTAARIRSGWREARPRQRAFGGRGVKRGRASARSEGVA